MKPIDHETRMLRVRTVLDGLSIGDAFGQQFFSPYFRDMNLPRRELPPPRWNYTDDTVMALGVAEVLEGHGRIEQDELARNFANRFRAEPDRGYGSGARRLLIDISHGGDWRGLSRTLFYGEGSFGNGAAMRVAPTGAYFCDNMTSVVEAARLSAEITHAHEDGIAGAIAVAVATAWAKQRHDSDSRDMLRTVIQHTPPGVVRDRIAKALTFSLDDWEQDVANELGNGSQLAASDTVPFCLWCAAARLDDFAAAMWAAVAVDGDRDTNCAIVGGIVAAAVGDDGIPDIWRRSRESLWLRSDS